MSESLELLTAEVRVLREVLDELREETQWFVRNTVADQESRSPPFHLTSMPLDPMCRDFAERINAITRDNLPASLVAEVEETATMQQQATHAPQEPEPTMTPTSEELEDVEVSTYCCDKPNLMWYGDPESPGIECAHCHFPVAHEGDILCWRETGEGDSTGSENPDTKLPDAEPVVQQRELF